MDLFCCGLRCASVYAGVRLLPTSFAFVVVGIIRFIISAATKKGVDPPAQGRIEVAVPASAVYAITSLTAGRSLESAIPAVLQDLKMLYPHDDAPIIQEFRELVFKLNNG